MDQSAQLLLHGCEGRQGQCRQLEVRGLWSWRAVQDRLEEGRHDEAGRHRDRLWLARPRRHELGAFAGSYFARGQEAVLRASFGHGRWRKYSCSGGAVMRGVLVAAIVAMTWWPVSVPAQTAPRGVAKASAKGAVPRASDGKPDLTGVWQGGSNQRGSWEEANAGLGVGGT